MAQLLWAEQRAQPRRRAHALRRDPRLLPVLLQPRPGGPRARDRGAAARRRRGARVQPGLGPAVAPLQRELRVRGRARRDPHRPGRRLRRRTACASTRRASGPGPRSPGRCSSRASSRPPGPRREKRPRAQPGLPRLPRVDRLAADAARRLGARPGPGATGARRRNPHVIPVAHHALWLAHLRRGEIEEAYQAALQYRDPTFFWRALMRACCLGHLGRLAEARRGGGRAARDEARLREPRPHADRPPHQVPRPARARRGRARKRRASRSTWRRVFGLTAR